MVEYGGGSWLFWWAERGGITFVMSWKGVVSFFVLSFSKAVFCASTMFFLNNLQFLTKMGNETAYLMPIKYKIFLAPWTPANTSLTDYPSHKHAQRLDDSRGKWATRGNLKLVEAWKLWWKWYTNGEFIMKLCEFYPLKQVFLGF